jgi:hypothetical protein
VPPRFSSSQTAILVATTPVVAYCLALCQEIGFFSVLNVPLSLARVDLFHMVPVMFILVGAATAVFAWASSGDTMASSGDTIIDYWHPARIQVRQGHLGLSPIPPADLTSPPTSPWIRRRTVSIFDFDGLRLTNAVAPLRSSKGRP